MLKNCKAFTKKREKILEIRFYPLKETQIKKETIHNNLLKI